ncbi:transglycosylase SLT domain-containing protein [Xanthobacteraceae bacterium Astr-EGSB]|uniref:lytic transglycosylase domain-containing protein n=1 Tax=Astrobacterium formosum TaxID=3069710 RepID=UPI0027B2CBD6|nr:transglycosylase SLT domain-containing protein [Xanthobacteraceae bacterium Astr-EGSB]
MRGKASILPTLIGSLFIAAMADRQAAASPDWMAFVELPGHVHGLVAADQPNGPEPVREDITHEELCEALVMSAREKRLPVTFFTNLIWKESRFDSDAVSPAGAEGIAQFMPAVSKVMGFDPFDPREAIPAAARLLRVLLDRFGNLGLAAAAYNAGPARVREWMDRKSGLPAETRDYVADITGRHADRWRGRETAPDGFLVPARVPCHRVEAFSDATRGEHAKALAALASAAKAAAAKTAAKKAGTRKGRLAKTAAKTPAKTRLGKTKTAKSRVAAGRGTAKARSAASKPSAAKTRGRAKARPAAVRSAGRKKEPLG